MAKHAHGLECISCQIKLLQADPYLVNWFNSIVKIDFPDAHISWAFRGQKDQQQAFNTGKSKLPWPRSKHNFLDDLGKPRARALDLFRLLQNGRADFSVDWYLQIVRGCEERGDPIRCGARFVNFKDYCHFEMNKGSS